MVFYLNLTRLIITLVNRCKLNVNFGLFFGRITAVFLSFNVAIFVGINKRKSSQACLVQSFEIYQRAVKR